MGAKRMVREDEIALGGFRFTSTDVWLWHDGIKNLRHYVPLAQNDWQKEDAAGASALDFPFDAGTGRISARVTPSAFGTHNLRKRIILPRDFGIFAATSPITIVTRRSNTNTSLKAYLYNGTTVDAGINGVSVNPSVAATWETFTLTPSGTYNAGDFVTFQVEYVAAANGRTVEVADLAMSYKTNRGNI